MGLFKRGKVWWMSLNYQGRQIRRSTETTDRRRAEAILGKLRANIVEGKFFDKLQEQERTIKDMMERYFEERGNKLATARALWSTAQRLYEILGAERVLAETTSDLIAQYKTRRAADGMKPASINRELALLSVAFNMARRQWKWCRHNPVSEAGLCPGEVARDRWLTQEEETRLLPVCPLWLQELVRFDLNTGLRVSELVALTWPAVDLQRKILTVLKSKNKTKRVVPLNQTALAILKNRLRSTKTDRVFYSARHTPYLGNNIWRAFSRAAMLAKVENMRFHDLRHAFATRLVQNGVDLYRVQRLLGHKDATMTQRYAHHCPESLRAGVDALDITISARSGVACREAVG